MRYVSLTYLNLGLTAGLIDSDRRLFRLICRRLGVRLCDPNSPLEAAPGAAPSLSRGGGPGEARGGGGVSVSASILNDRM